MREEIRYVEMIATTRSAVWFLRSVGLYRSPDRRLVSAVKNPWIRR